MQTHRTGTWIVLMLIAVFAVTAGGCRKAREKQQKFNYATNAAVNAMLFANPLAAVFGSSSGSKDENNRYITAADSGVVYGCPEVRFEGVLIPLISKQSITVNYGEDCLSHGLVMSGAFNGEWEFSLSRFRLYLDMLLTLDDLTIEGLTSNGQIHALASINSRGPYATLDGEITTTHADGRFRTMTYDNMSAVIDLNEALLVWLLGDDDELDNATLLNPYDDALILNGHASYIDEDNMTSAVTYTDVTQIAFCFYPVAGTMRVVNDEEGLDALIDFGEGECDSVATVIIEGETREVDIREWLEKRRYRYQ